MEYYYKCFNRIIKLNLKKNKTSELDFWLKRFCPNVEILDDGNKFDICIDCYEQMEYDYLLEDNSIRLYGKFENYESFLAKFITQVFQKILIKDEIVIIPAACVGYGNNCLLVIGDYWQGKTSTSLNIAKKYNLDLVSDNYIAIKDLKVIGTTQYISKREEDIKEEDITEEKLLLKVNNRYFYSNSCTHKINNLSIKGFLLPFINSTDNNIHYISKEESKWYLYQKFIRLLSGETVLFNGTLPSPIFLDKESSQIILNIVNKLLNNTSILYISSSIDKIVDIAIKAFENKV